MTGQKKSDVIPDVMVLNKIYHICSFFVMLDSDLIKIYAVETKRLNEKVKRIFDFIN
jgi:hypothetical protein